MMIEWYLVSYVALMNIQGKFCFGITKFPPEGSPPNAYCISGVLSINITSRMLTAGWLWFTHSALSLPAEALCLGPLQGVQLLSPGTWSGKLKDSDKHSGAYCSS